MPAIWANLWMTEQGRAVFPDGALGTALFLKTADQLSPTHQAGSRVHKGFNGTKEIQDMDDNEIQ